MILDELFPAWIQLKSKLSWSDILFVLWLMTSVMMKSRVIVELLPLDLILEIKGSRRAAHWFQSSRRIESHLTFDQLSKYFRFIKLIFPLCNILMVSFRTKYQGSTNRLVRWVTYKERLHIYSSLWFNECFSLENLRLSRNVFL